MKMRRRNSKGIRIFLGMLLAACVPAVSQAALMTVSYDLVIGQADTNFETASAVVQMDFASGVLTILIQNTSSGQVAGAAGVLTGIGFNLPGTLNIVSGTVAAASGSNPVGSITSSWGFDPDSTGSSGFYSLIGSNTINSNVRTVTPGGLTAMSGSGGVNVQGPNYGILYAGGDGGGLEGLVTDALLITLNLSGSYAGDVVSYINNNFVVVGFGSPTTVPEPSALLLLGGGLVGLFGFSRWRMKR